LGEGLPHRQREVGHRQPAAGGADDGRRPVVAGRFEEQHEAAVAAAGAADAVAAGGQRQQAVEKLEQQLELAAVEDGKLAEALRSAAGEALEGALAAPAAALAEIRGLARRYGPRAVVWRYDPVLLSSLTPPAWHRATFARLAAALAGACDEAVLSFAQIYAKTRNNTDRAAARHGFAWRDPETEEKRALLVELAGLAAEHGLTARLCAQPELVAPALAPAACIDARRLSDLAGRDIAARRKGNRPGCLCAESRDIGAYDSCPHGCVYCYAVRRPELAKQRFRGHDPAADSLTAPAAPPQTAKIDG